MRSIVIACSAIASCVVLTSGCSAIGGAYDLPLPGGADLGDHPFHVTAEFRDVLDLVPQSAVKVNDVTVGRVEQVELHQDGRSALVTVAVNGAVTLPGNAVARLRQSSVLGEKFVELDKPPGAVSEGKLTEGARIPLARTDRNPEIEEVFGALSMLLNGGGVGQLQNITREFNAALGGNEAEIRSFLTGLNTFIAGLDDRKAEITRALDAMSGLAESLASRKDQIANLIENLGPGIDVLTQQREQFVTMMRSLDLLSGTAVHTIKESKDDLVADLRALEPTMRRLTEAGQNLPKAMEILFTFPFTNGALDAVKGDYINTYLRLDTKVPRATVAGEAPALPLPSAGGGG